MPLWVPAQLHIIPTALLSIKINNIFFSARTIQNLEKRMLDSNRTFKVKARSHWTDSEI